MVCGTHSAKPEDNPLTPLQQHWYIWPWNLVNDSCRLHRCLPTIIISYTHVKHVHIGHLKGKRGKWRVENGYLSSITKTHTFSSVLAWAKVKRLSGLVPVLVHCQYSLLIMFLIPVLYRIWEELIFCTTFTQKQSNIWESTPNVFTKSLNFLSQNIMSFS